MGATILGDGQWRSSWTFLDSFLSRRKQHAIPPAHERHNASRGYRNVVKKKTSKPKRTAAVKKKPRRQTESQRRAREMEALLVAIDKVQCVIEFNLDGTVRHANELFLRAFGYGADEVNGRHHTMFVDAAHRDSIELEQFWAKLRRGEFETGRFKRVGKDAGRSGSRRATPDLRPERRPVQGGQLRDGRNRPGRDARGARRRRWPKRRRWCSRPWRRPDPANHHGRQIRADEDLCRERQPPDRHVGGRRHPNPGRGGRRVGRCGGNSRSNCEPERAHRGNRRLLSRRRRPAWKR